MNGIIRTGVCFFCHDGKGNYLLSLRSKNARDEQERWDPGGGGLRFGEKIEDAVVREVREEYAAMPLEVEFLGYRDVFRAQNGTQTHWIVFDFRVRVDPAAVKNEEPHKCDGLRWVSVGDIETFPKPLHSQFLFFYDKYKRHFI